jgi:amino acid adenylation domain-containing protein
VWELLVGCVAGPVPLGPGFRLLNLGGEAVSGAVLARWFERVGVPVYNTYGPTEATITCVAGLLREAVVPVPIGGPIAATVVYVLDGGLRPVPVGVAGELYIGGAALARGYGGRSALTAERFVADPFAGDGSRLYRSGDRVRWSRGGQLEFVGRADDQVKVRGFRIEPGEVEAELSTHPGVRTAVVTAWGEHADRHLVAYVIPANADAGLPAVAELRAHLSRSLPDFMIPSSFVELAELPLNRNGKLDRAALPAPESAAAGADRYVAPEGATEELLAGVWARLLGVERVGAEDNFFELGGHSLLATQVVSRIREVFGVEVPLGALFDAPTVRGLAVVVRDAVSGPQAPALVRADRGGPLPLSFAQQRLWFLDQLDPGSTGHVLPSPMEWRGPLDVAALGAALGAVVARHEVLRTRLVAGADGNPYQVIDPPAPFPLPVADVSTAANPLAMAQEIVAVDSVTPFDLAAGPLIRAVLIRLAPEEHVLALSVHHVVSDEWSDEILRRELRRYYRAFAAGEADPLRPLTLQYADFAVWQRQWLTSEVLDDQLAYWRDRLSGAATLDLPADRRRPPVRSADGAVTRFSVSAPTAQALRRLARDGGTTMFMTAFAAFATLLQRYSGQDDIVVGTPVANRTRTETEAMIGFFVNTLVLRTDLSGDPSFREILARVRETALGAYAHQDIPFEQVVDAIVVDRDRSRTPLFQVFFSYDTDKRDGSEPNAGPPAGEPHQRRSVQFDMSVRLGATGDGLAGEVQYSTALYDPATADRMAAHLVTLLDAVATDPDRPLSRLTVLSAPERHRLVEEWNDTTAPMPPVGGIAELIEAQAAVGADVPAVVCGARVLTYATLLSRAGRLARVLRARGVGPESVVGICLERGVDMVVAVLAVWQAGGAYLPLDPEYPAERLEFMLADSGAHLLVGRHAVGGMDPLSPDCDDATPDEAGAPAARPGQLAYVIYTSGSTGRPKGVHVTQGSLVNMTEALRPVLGAGPGVRSLQFASFSFDAAARDIAVVLAAGGTLVVADAARRSEPESLAAMIRQAGVSTAAVAPSLLNVLDPAALPGVTTLCTGSERVGAQVVRAWAPGRRMLVTYGPTETTVISTATEVTAGEPGVPPIGTPVANTRVYVLDAGLNPVPVGVAGDLLIGGSGVARGYGRRPALTAERFVADPFAADGSRLYRSGDRARWRADGRLEFLDRSDEQVKVRGFRVEPAEVEAVLTRHPGVRAAVVTAYGEDTDRRLAAYLVPSDPGAGLPAVGELREHLLRSVPEFLVPAAFVEISEIPLSPNGKTDRAALPAPDGDRAGLTEYEAPVTATEELLAGIWAQVLGVDRVGRGDDFFELGGHSLLATQVMSRVRQASGAEVPLAALFDAPTVAGLATAVEQAAGHALPPITPAGRDEPLPLSFAQQRLWFLDRLEPGSVEYNLPVPVQWTGPLDVRAMAAALSAVVARHEVLRTRLVADPDGTAYQVVDPPAPFPLPVVDLSGLPDPVQAAEALVERDAGTPFDLAAGPLVRAVLVRLRPDDHLLAMSMHHVVSDGWSGRILQQEVRALYQAFRAGRPDPLPPLPVQYADFAVWQRRSLPGEVLDDQLAYWREQLAGSPVLELPTDRPRPPVRSADGAVTGFTIPASIAEGLRAVARDRGASMFMTLLAGLDVLLAWYCRADDVSVGTPVANRNRVETESLIGFFVNTLVLRTDLSGDPSFAELVGRVRQTALAAYAHQDLPFERLVDALVSERDRSRTPLFQVFLNYDEGGHGDERPDGSDRAAQPHRAAQPQRDAGPDPRPVSMAVQFDLQLSIEESPDGSLRAGLQYSTALFDPETIGRMAEHLTTLLEAAAAHPDRALSALPMLTAGERRTVVQDWNDTAAPLPVPPTTPGLIAQRADGGADAAVLFAGTTALTRGGLLARAGRLARHLRELGVAADSVVGLCLPRGADMVVAALAIWQAGAAYLPLDPDYPAERLEFMLADSAATVLVGHRDIAAGLAAGRRAVWLDDPEVRAAVAAQPGTPPEVPVAADALAYVIYTSGSTGRPKGVQVTHGNLANFLAGMAERPGLTARDVLLSVTTLGFDIAGLELWLPLVTGGRSVVAGRDTVRAPAALAAEIRRCGATVVQATPATWQMLADDGWAGLPGLRVLCGGEALPPGLAAALRDRAGQVWNMYGPTETTIWSTCERVTGDRVTLGTPIANTLAFVLDPHLRPVPAGVAGELFLGGAGVARGYGGRPALTAERFVADPFTADGSRLYRTGDLVRWLPGGRLEFLGRIDQQVKVRGFRIEPGEIETILAAHPRVRTAVVTTAGDGADRRLVAYLVPAGDADGLPPAGELREHLRGQLPEFMVPAVFTELAALPLTPNGKLDRAALPAPDTGQPDGAGFVAPATPTEELLAGIWAQVLGVDRVGGQDDFFELGGHSLLATRVIARIREAFGVDLPLAALFDEPTVARLARVVDRSDRTVAPPITVVSRAESLPLSYSQQRLWFLEQLEPGSTEYNMALRIPLGPDVDPAALEAALAALVERHEVLRTRLAADRDGVAEQVVLPPAAVPIPVVDVSGDADPVRLAESLVRRNTAVPFDLASGSMLRALLLRIAGDESVLALSLHHVIFDEWSGQVLRRDLAALYRAARTGRPAALPALPVQYADYAAWQRSWLSGEVLEDQLAYWRDQLAGAPLLELPTDRPRPAVRSIEGSHVEFSVPAEAAAGVREVARTGGATLFMTLLAAFTVVMSRYSGQDDVVLSTPVANRGRAQLEDLIGFFVNTLVLRTDLSGDPSFLDLLHRVRRTALDAYAHQDVPFERLVDELVTDRDRSRSPLAQVSFSFDPVREADAPEAAGSGVVAAPEAGQRTLPVQFDLVVTMGEDTGGTLHGEIQYSTALYDAATVQRLAGHLTTLLAAVAADPSRPVRELSLLPGAEQDRILGTWNDTTVPVPSAGGVHQLIAECAAARPDAVAVLCGAAGVTYAELTRRAGRLAAYLRGAGVGAETVVGVCLPRGIDMVVAVLAVWQAGAAYLPLDPKYPADRLTYMLADSRATVLLGTAGLLDELPVGRTRTVVLDDPAVRSALATLEAAPPAEVAPGQIAYVIYTSGSTGRPKGVEVPHGGVVGLATAQRRTLAITDRDVVLQFAPFSFDASVWELIMALTAGARLVLATAPERAETRHLTALVARAGVSVATVPPSLLDVLDPGDLRGVGTLITAGERLAPGLARQWNRGRRLYNAYGPTETTVCASVARCEDVPPGATPPIGGPIANTRLYVLDRNLRPVPAGVPGELFIAGLQVARGYRGRPALSAERFLADPFAADGSRMYRSGDRVRWQANGELEYVGRVDEQIKVRGFRIEPGEIEAVLAGHPAVQTAAVAAFGEGAQASLAAYLVPADPEAGLPDPDMLRAFAAGRLPSFMVPSDFVELASLPLTPNGKTDRAALPRPDGPNRGRGAYVAPSTPQEELLAGIWREVLRRERVGATDNFFELGGNSLMVTQIVGRIRAAGYDLSVGDLFDHPTIGQAATLLQAREEDPEVRSAVPVRTGTVLPAVFAVHTFTGEVAAYAETAEHLPEGLQMYGLQARGLTGADTPPETVEEMAAAYIPEMLRAQPDGPYVLIAQSGGCYVAVEMARQLVEMGRQVGAVLLLGPAFHRTGGKASKRDDEAGVREMLRELTVAIRAGSGTPLSKASVKRLQGYRAPDDEIKAGVAANDEHAFRIMRAVAANRRAYRAYGELFGSGLRPYEGRVILFMPAEDQPRIYRDTLDGWRTGLHQEPEVVDVPANHSKVLYGDSARLIGGRIGAEIAHWQRFGETRND